MTAPDPTPSQPSNLPLFTTIHRLLTVVLLIVISGLALSTLNRLSPAGPEATNIMRGVAFWRTGHLLPADQPPLAALINGAAVLLEPGLPDPASLAGWDNGDVRLLAHQFLWEPGLNVSRVLLFARLPSIWLGLLTVALLWRWGYNLYGRWGATFAAALAAFSPNLIAHMRLATADVATCFLMLLTLYAWSRFRSRGRIGGLVTAGISLGLALSCSYYAVALLPALLITTPIISRQSGGFSAQQPFLKRLFEAANRLPLGWAFSALLGLLLLGLVGAITFLLVRLAVYHTLSLPDYLAGLQQALTSSERLYLLNRFVRPANRAGWWYGPLLALVAKLPLPTLVLFLLASILAVSRHFKARDWEIVIPNWVLLAAACLFPAGMEIRTLLPVVLLIALFSARLAGERLRSGWLRPALVSPFVALLILTNGLAYPAYLSFSNVIARRVGPTQLFVGSNLDWGQDLPVLAEYLASNPTQPVFLSLSSSADPAYYGIAYNPLPGQASLPLVSTFRPLSPPPGLYAISATNLVGLPADLNDTFGYFRTRTPLARVGDGIFIYQVSPHANVAAPWFAQCALEAPFERVERLVQLTGKNDLRTMTFDCRQGLPFYDGPGWLLVPAGIEPVADLGPADYTARFPDGSLRYRVWQVDGPPGIPTPAIEFPSAPLPIPIAGYVELVGYQVQEPTTDDSNVTLVTWWRVRDVPPPPVAIFAGLLNGGQTPLYLDEQLGVALDAWRPGLIFAQQHVIPADAVPTGSYTLITGLSVPGTSQRYPVSQSGDRVVDRIVLRSVDIGG
jgi:hypothetical protein